MQDTEQKCFFNACFIKISVKYGRDARISNVLGSCSEHNAFLRFQHAIPKFVTLCEYPDDKNSTGVHK